MLEFLTKSYAVASEFMKPKPKFDTYWINFLFDWQTLVAAIVAGVPAIIGAYLLWRQIDIQRLELERLRRKEETSARIQLISVLASLTRYYKSCITPILDGSHAVTDIPNQSLATLMSSAPTLDDKVFRHIQSLIVEFQIFTSRYPSATRPLANSLREIILVDLGRLHSATNALYPYARFETDAVEPAASTKNATRDSINNLIAVTNRSISENDRLLIERALNDRFPRKTSSTVPPVEP
ncbi:hypothetical protein EHI44_22120 [Rhizobium leguminosarum]|uniref:hypothetical protein n=1 Tax=Rhizobium leguminosarum TaxID=384 RepID=UPI000FEF684E|nr:hypothetical protein [Rhizobium leguminosarum]RWY83428.1 hypothetical protein EHI44_22120 [Rhizobium leguminosarum]